MEAFIIKLEAASTIYTIYRPPNNSNKRESANPVPWMLIID